MSPEELIIKALEKAVIPEQKNNLIEVAKQVLPLLITLAVAWLGFKATLKQAEKSFDAQLKTALISRNTELDKQFIEMKLSHFMEAQNSIEQFNNTFSDYCANVRNWNDHQRDGNYEKLPYCDEEHTKLERECYAAFLILSCAESKLLILGKLEVHQNFQKYREHARQIYRTVYLKKSSKGWEEKDWNEYTKNIQEQSDELNEYKRALMKQLGEEIENEHNKQINRKT